MRLLTALVVGLALVSTASAQYTMIDDFDAYTLGTIHDQGGWQVQRNSSALGDPGWVTVVDDGTGNQVVQMINRDIDDAIDTIYACVDLGVSLNGTDTIKMTFRASGPNDTIMGTNDMLPGYDYDGSGEASNADDYQGTTNYSEQGAMVRLSAGEEFRARDGGGYYNVAGIGTTADTWYDLYMLVDSPNDRTIYAMAPAGGAPQIIMSPDDVWWGHRNDAHDNNAVENLKFFIGMYPWPAADTETIVQIDNIQYMEGFDPSVPEPATMSLLALGGLALIRRRR